MLVIVDFNQYLPAQTDRHSATNEQYAEIVRYFLYREYFLDTNTYFLTTHLLSLYCQCKMDLLESFTHVGNLVRHQSLHMRKTVVHIDNRDAYVFLLKEVTDE